MWTFLLPVGIGVALATQTAANSRLRSYVLSPFLTSFLSFSVGTLILYALFFIGGDYKQFDWAAVRDLPLWLFTGGLLGLCFLTMNVVLFKKIGAIQTAVLPIMGQLIMSVLIDQFGWFRGPQHRLTVMTVIGLVLLIVGVCIVTDIFYAKKQVANTSLFWQIVGVLGGTLSSMQAAVNGQLGQEVGSVTIASTISFTVGVVLLFLILVVTRTSFQPIRAAVQASPKEWWMWTGGLLGAIYVFGIAYFVPIIGTGEVIVLVLFGQLLFSACIDHFALFGAVQKRMTTSKAIGLLCMLIAVGCIKLFA